MMTDEVFCGLVITGEKEKPCGVAFLNDDLESFSVTEDEEILTLMDKHKPDVIAFNVPLTGPGKTEGFREDEEDLVDEGYSFLPPAVHDDMKLERAVFLKNSIKRMEFMPELVECRPELTSEILKVKSDAELEDRGFDPSPVSNVREFNAVLAAITAKLYSNDGCVDKGVLVPEEGL
ncbi:MAG: hypothetical protein MUP58_01115 [Candidatus Nanohaloarchaeota archaeon QJJ-9]|nr:hypothetical protein [Candidatus Nanohaloarchaeota archaeon QJJ-9]